MKLLKNKVTLFALLGALGSNVAVAGIAFDLQAQHFSKAIEGEYQGARYELPEAFVTTNLKYVDGTYLTQSNTGNLNVEVKTPVSEWSVSVDAYYILGTDYKKTRTIKMTSENGESILISFRNDAITFNGEKVYTPGERKRMTVAVTQNTSQISLVINGVAAGTATRETFGKLKYVDVQAIHESDNSVGTDYDYINGLTIGSK